MGKVRTDPHLFSAHPLEQSLALAVLRVLDVLARVQKGLALKDTVNITPVRTVASGPDDCQQPICLFRTLPAAILPTGPALAVWSFFRFLQERGKLLV